jgi:SWIM zinc finger
MTITISSQEPRSIKAVEIAAGCGQWLRCRTRHGRKLYGVPSQTTPAVCYLVDCQGCTCQDFQRQQRQPCKHVLAVRLYVELVRAQQGRQPRSEVRAA